MSKLLMIIGWLVILFAVADFVYLGLTNLSVNLIILIVGIFIVLFGIPRDK